MTGPSYAFGSGDDAAARLYVLADVFAPAMGALLAELPERNWPVVVDLGCGPGSSTAHLARLLDVGELIGLDAAASFVERATQRVPMARFAVSDITAPAWPAPPADLLYTRFVLSHLPRPVQWIERWRERLTVGGALLVEEVEAIDTDIAVFDDYLALVDGLVASRGGTMRLGPYLAAADLDGVVLNRPFAMDVAVADAATMFALNLRSWRADPWVVGHRSPYELDILANGLEDLRSVSTGPDARGSIRWTIRQLIVGGPPSS